MASISVKTFIVVESMNGHYSFRSHRKSYTLMQTTDHQIWAKRTVLKNGMFVEIRVPRKMAGAMLILLYQYLNSGQPIIKE